VVRVFGSNLKPLSQSFFLFSLIVCINFSFLIWILLLLQSFSDCILWYWQGRQPHPRWTSTYNLLFLWNVDGNEI
jgi:hypothetical protein